MTHMTAHTHRNINSVKTHMGSLVYLYNFTWFKTVVNITSLFAFSTRTRRHTNYLATLVIWKHIQNDVLRVNEVISQELQIWVVHSLFAAGVTSARRTTMSSTSSSSSACRLRAKDRDGQWHARSSIALSAATQPQTHIALHTRRNLLHRFGLHEHPVKRLFDEFRVLGAAHAHEANKDIKLGDDISCAEQLRGRWHSLAQDAYFKGQPLCGRRAFQRQRRACIRASRLCCIADTRAKHGHAKSAQVGHTHWSHIPHLGYRKGVAAWRDSRAQQGASGTVAFS